MFCIHVIIAVFFIPGRVPKSSSMATLAMRAPTDRHPLRIRCTTPTWSRLRQKLSDSTPHSTQSARWYSVKQTLPLPVERFTPSPSCSLCCGLTGQRRKTDVGFHPATTSSLCCSMLVWGQHNSNSALTQVLASPTTLTLHPVKEADGDFISAVKSLV